MSRLPRVVSVFFRQRFTTGRILALLLLSAVPLAYVVTAQTASSVGLATARSGHTATAIGSGHVFVAGGANQNGLVVGTEIVDLAGSQTIGGPNLLTPRTDHTATMLPSGLVLIAGGNGAAGALASTELFDPATGTLAAGPSLTSARAGHTATVLGDGSVLFVGGDGAGSAEIYQPSSGTFSPVGSLTVARSAHAAAVLPDGIVMIAGGTGNDGSALASVELFDPGAGQFTLVPGGMQAARVRPVLNVLPDSKVQIIGGDAASTFEMFDYLRWDFKAMAALPPLSSLVSPTLATASRRALLTTSIAQNPNVTPYFYGALGRDGFATTGVGAHAVVVGGTDASGQALNSIVEFPASAATITTQWLDYAPGTQVTITGTGWMPGETVTILLHQVPTNRPDTTVTAVADSAGNILNTDFATVASDYQTTFTLTATGSLSGYAAQTAFSDAQPRTIDFFASVVSGGTITPFTVNVTDFTNSAGQTGKTTTLTVPSNNKNSLATTPGTSVTFSFPASITVGSGTYPAVSVNVDGVTTTLNAASQFTFTSASSAGTSNLTINYGKATPTITWSNPADITYGTALSPTQLNATASVPGSFVYSPIGGTVLNASSSPQTLSVTFTPTDTTSYNTATKSVTINVLKAPASVTPNAASKTYGDADPTLTGTLSGFLAADNVTATYARTAGETVAGGPYTISATLGPTNVLTNYNITYNTANFTINRKAASVTPNAASKTYGDADPTLTGTLSGFLAADNVTASYSRTAGETVAGSPYTISAALSPASVLTNYDIKYNTANFTINRRAASVAPNAASKTYGDPDPAFSGTLTGFIAADGVTATYSRSTGETVAGSPYTISATLSPALALDNYNVQYGTATFTINKRAASVAPNAASKTYGDADPAFSGTLTGFLAADGVTATYGRSAGETVGGSPYTISATLSPALVLNNYNVQYGTATFTINKRAASVTPSAASKTYGDSDPALTGTLAGFIAGDGVTATYSRTSGETVGGYTISATLAPVGPLANYDITYNTAPFTINKRTASVTPNAASKTYGDSDPTLTGTLAGFLAGDGVMATYSRTSGETVGGYTISATLAPAGPLTNYDITYNTATFTINKRTASVTPNAVSKTYGDSDPALTGTLAGFIAGDGVTATYSRTSGETVGGYTISATLAPAGPLTNYDITYNTATFTINRRAASVTPNAASKTYGGADPSFTGTLSGFLTSDGVTAAYSRIAGETAGSYAISATLSPAGVLGNYAITYNTAIFTINKATLTVTGDQIHMIVGTTPVPPLTYTISGYVNGETLATSGVSGAPSLVTSATPASPVGSYAILVSNGTLVAANYQFAFVNGTLSIQYASAGTMCAGDIGHAILQPIKADGSGVFKSGSTVPTKFRVCDASGNSVGTPGVVAGFQYWLAATGTVTDVAQTTTISTNDLGFRWDSTAQQWIMNMSTAMLTGGSKGAPATYGFRILLNDGTSIQYFFGVK